MNVTHFQPAQLPALGFIPALAMDLAGQQTKADDWVKALLMSIAFVGLLLAIQYPLSGFLLQSPAARNWFFGAEPWYFGTSPNATYQFLFSPPELPPLPDLTKGCLVAIGVGWLCAR